MITVVNGEYALQVLDLRQIIVGDVGVRWIVYQVVLVIALGRVKPFQVVHAGDDGAVKYTRRAQLGDIGGGDVLLRIVAVDDRGAILRARVRSLPVQLGRIVHHGEEYLQQLAV